MKDFQMSSRGRPLPPGMMRHGRPSGAGGLHPLPPELAEKEIVAQVAEIDHLVVENRRLASAEVALRQDLHGAHDEIQRLRAHIRSIQTENDIQIRMFLEKIDKMETDIKAGESIKKDLEEAHKEVQTLVAARRDLTSKIQQASQELEKCRIDVKKVPEMLSEIDNMNLEHQKLRSTFENEKRANLELVEHMQDMERKLVGMMREVERLRAEVSNAEKRAQAPYGGAYPTTSPQYPPHVQSNGPYFDPYGRSHPQMGGTVAVDSMHPVPHVTANRPPHPVGANPHPQMSVAPSMGMAWGGAYGPNITGK